MTITLTFVLPENLRDGRIRERGSTAWQHTLINKSWPAMETKDVPAPGEPCELNGLPCYVYGYCGTEQLETLDLHATDTITQDDIDRLYHSGWHHFHSIAI